MTDSSEDGNYLVRVRAQVMSRDDSSGGWVPLGGGGLSNVSVRKRPRPSPAPVTAAADTKPKHDYLIFGKRISDNSIVLSCMIKKDFEYNKVMPTFHHWKTGDKKFGLTFQAAADARAFDKGVRTAVEDLLDGFAETSPSSPLPKCPKDVDDDDVFMTLNLPQEPQDSRSSSDSSTKGSTEHHRIHFIPREKALEPRQPTYESSENYPYVQLQPVHEYIYPAEEPQKTSLMRRESEDSLKKDRPIVCNRTTPSVCRFCNQTYTDATNRRGACDLAPDPTRNCIDKVSCMCGAQCVFYHCASDAEGDFAHHPCVCTNDDGNSRRWFALTMLAMIIPCLWFYPPLRLCHWCGKKCGLCGGQHAT